MNKISNSILLFGCFILIAGCGQKTDLAKNVESSRQAAATFTEDDASQAQQLDAEQEYERITAEFETKVADLKAKLAKCDSNEQKQELFASSNPLPTFLETLGQFADTNANTDIGLKAALEIVARTKAEQHDLAMQSLIKNFAQKLNYSELILTFQREVPSSQVESWFDLLVEHASNSTDKANAVLGMAKYVDRIPEFANGFIKNPHLLSKLPKEQQQYLQATRTEEQDQHMFKLLNFVIENHGDDEDTAFASTAKQELYELQFLSVGKQVPEIVGKDLDGIEFRLSDYRGKVVMLDFWGHWCPPCRAMYEQERVLVEKLGSAPFVLLGVNSDRKLDVARDAVEDEGLVWRHFWNGPRGTEGSIASQWNIESWPTVYLIDGDGIIQHKNLLGEDLDRALQKMLADAGHDVDLQIH